LLTADLLVPKLSAAFEKLPFSTTATKTGMAEKVSIKSLLLS
jgi:hypothetical protein